MDKLLVICGPTATGKTNLAMRLAKVLNGVAISADSRQVYKYMDIGTGKGKEKVLGYDLVNPNDEFSVSLYLKFAKKAIKKIEKEGKLPILVGGTGLYIKAVVDGIDTINVPQDKTLREKLLGKTRDELFEILKKLNKERAKDMNESDRKNPRRLIRAIEIASSNFKTSKKIFSKYDVAFVGLTTNEEGLRERINMRVENRIENGFEKEIRFLKKHGFWENIAKETLGYKDWPDIDKWKIEEFKYAKRQMTWFRRNERIKWFDISKKNYQLEVEKYVKKWYSQTIKDAKKN